MRAVWSPDLTRPGEEGGVPERDKTQGGPPGLLGPPFVGPLPPAAETGPSVCGGGGVVTELRPSPGPQPDQLFSGVNTD